MVGTMENTSELLFHKTLWTTAIEPLAGSSGSHLLQKYPLQLPQDPWCAGGARDPALTLPG